MHVRHEFKSLSDLLVDQLEDLYDAEQRLARALPKMAEIAHAPPLKRAFQEHQEQTRRHIERLETVFRKLNHAPERESGGAMKGLLREGEKMMSAKGDPEVRDAALIAAAQLIEHYAMAAYGSARSFALRLGYTEATQLLQKTLQEEAAADKALTQLAETEVNARAAYRPAERA